MALCGRCQARDDHFLALDLIRSRYWYDETGRNFWRAVKFRRRHFLLQGLTDLLKPLELDPPLLEGVVVPVPMTFARFRKRGMNLSEWLALMLSQRYGLFLEGELLKRVGSAMPHSLSNRRERFKNIRGTLKVNRARPMPRKVLLIDDVITTGATLAECAQVLKKSGVEEVSAWTLFRTPDLTSFRNALGRIPPPQEHRRDQHHTDY